MAPVGGEGSAEGREGVVGLAREGGEGREMVGKEERGRNKSVLL